MKSLYITIIIIILLCEIYLRYFDNTKNIKEEIKNNEKIKNTDIKIIPEPWDKIKNKTNYNIYYIRINIFNDDNYIKWKNITTKIDYNITNKYFIIKTLNVEEALAIANLYISCLNNEIDINEIIDNDLIQLSTNKAMANNLVSLKLIELIKEGQNKINNTGSYNTGSYNTGSYNTLNNNTLNNNTLNNNTLNDNTLNDTNVETFTHEDTTINYKNIDDDDNDTIEHTISLPDPQIKKMINNPIQNKVDCAVLSTLPLQNIVKIEPYTGIEFASY